MVEETSELQADLLSSSLARLAAAGYKVTEPVRPVHCLPSLFAWIANGFAQTHCEVGGVRCRVLDYAPRQSLQVRWVEGATTALLDGM